jgi:hypothetical protein
VEQGDGVFQLMPDRENSSFHPAGRSIHRPSPPPGTVGPVHTVQTASIRSSNPALNSEEADVESPRYRTHGNPFTNCGYHLQPLPLCRPFLAILFSLPRKRKLHSTSRADLPVLSLR